MANATTTPAEEGIADRGIPQLNTRRSGPPAALKIIMILAAVLAVLGAVGVFAVKKFQDKRQAENHVDTKAETTSKLPKLDETQMPGAETPLPDDMASAAGDPAATGGTNTPTPAAASGEQVVPALSPEQLAAADLRERRKRAPLVAYGEQQGAAQAAPAALGAVAAAVPGAWPYQAPPAAPEQPTGLEAALQSTAMAANSAQTLRDPSMTLTQASVIPCVLNTAINSTVPGMVSCTVSSNVYSTNGRVLLLDRGSRIVGQYQNGGFKQGMNRIFVLWTRVETPNGVTIALDSPAADSLGRSGVAGRVNRHFWERFGAGLLLSLVDDAVSYAVQQQDDGEGSDGVQFTNTSEAGRSAAAIAVESSVGIPPTLSVSQGSLLNVFVARDLYFGNVYGLRTATR